MIDIYLIRLIQLFETLYIVYYCFFIFSKFDASNKTKTKTTHKHTRNLYEKQINVEVDKFSNQ